ncbi:MATE family efflux transporter [Campylobacterota bacterium]|nr:MATE family efflux transporter [Campylobacterota bacterium]
MQNATDRIGTERIGKLLWDFSAPAIVGMVVGALYNITDRIYVGQGVDALGIAGITIAMPMMMVLMGSSMLIGIGANALFSIRLGEGRRHEVEKIMGHAFALLFLVPAAVIAVCFIWLDEIVINLLGASETVFPYAKTYLEIILYGGIFGAMGPGINHFIRSDGHPRTSMLTQLIGAGINIVLDPIFIFWCDWGIAGAAWATIISQFISFVWVMGYFNSRYTRLRFRLADMKLELKLCLSIMAIGFAPAAMEIAMSVVGALQNHSLNAYGGDMAVSAMGIVYSIAIVFFMPLFGIAQGAQPLIGYNYGAKKYDRVRQAFNGSLLAATIFMTAAFALMQAVPTLLIWLFHSEADELMAMSVYCLRVSTLVFPLVAFNMLSANYFQSIGKPIEGAILSLSRQLIIYLPLLFVLGHWFGLEGVFWAMPVSDILAVLLSAVFMAFEIKRLKRLTVLPF